MKNQLFLPILSSLLFLQCSQSLERYTASDYTQWVDPLIGTAPATTARVLGYGTEPLPHTIPSVTMPLGMTNWTPQTQATETKCVAPYYYLDSLINGFRGTHWLSGSCVQDYGSLTLMPQTGELRYQLEDRATPFSHQDEIATPARYEVLLPEEEIKVEMTATKRCGLFRIQFPAGQPAFLLIEPNSDEAQGFVKVLPEQNRIIGYNPAHRIYQGWGGSAGFSGYFVAEFNQVFADYGAYETDSLHAGRSQLQDRPGVGAYARFEASVDESLLVRIGTSFTSLEQAEKNLAAEVTDWDFDRYVRELRQSWNDILGRIHVEGANTDKTIFYTALYHAFQHPRLFSDVDGAYPGFGGDTAVQLAEGFNYYDDFPMWDIYRAALPLYHLIAPEISRDLMQSLIVKAEQGSWLPIFPCWNNYTAAMIGDHVTSALGDAFVKGIDMPEIGKAYTYMRQNAFDRPETFAEYRDGKGRRALESYLKYGYIPMEDSVQEAFHKKEQVSRTLEYAYDDFVLATVAERLGRPEDAQTLYRRAGSYQNVYDPNVGYVRGRYADGRWYEEFAPNRQMPYITEGTPKHYTWYVPHDVQGLIDLMGGDETFCAKLDTFFREGQYWHGNEPCHQTYYLYNYAGQPWKTQETVRKIMREEYHDGPGGLSGNEDGGQMSAWFVFSAMGFYPVCPGTDEYVLGSSLFDRIRIRRSGNASLEIINHERSEENLYIQSAQLNGDNYPRNYLRHELLTHDGKLEFHYGLHPNKTWGVSAENRPFSMSRK